MQEGKDTRKRTQTIRGKLKSTEGWYGDEPHCEPGAGQTTFKI